MKGTQTRTKRRSATARFKISKFVVFFICGFAITLFGDDYDHGSILLGGETDQNTHHKYNQGVANETNDEDDGKGNGDDIEGQDPYHHLHGNSSSYAHNSFWQFFF